MEKARLGLVLLRVDWSGWDEVQQLEEDTSADTAELLKVLGRDFELQQVWVVDSEQSAQACHYGLREADLDLVVAAFQTWSTDSLLVSLLPALSARPLVLWCYLPREASAARHLPRPVEGPQILLNSGPVGTFAALGKLHDLQVPFQFTYGSPDDPRLLNDLRVTARAARARQMLRQAKIGIIPYSVDLMLCNFVDEARLRDEIGPQVMHIAVQEYRRAMDEIGTAEVDLYLDRLFADFAVKNVSHETLREAARAVLGLNRLAQERALDLVGLVYNLPELQEAVAMRPSLYPPLLEGGKTLYQSETDLGAAVASLVLNWFTGSPVMLMEMWFWDGPKNQMIGGHSGMQNPQMAGEGQAWVSPDTYFLRPPQSEGAQIQFIARPGRVTLFQLRCTPRGWQAVATSGMCLESLPWTETCPHAVVRLDAHIDNFLKRIAALGVSQHWVMAYGSVLPELEAFCQMLNISLELVTE